MFHGWHYIFQCLLGLFNRLFIHFVIRDFSFIKENLIFYRREKPLSKYHMTLSGFEDKSERERVAAMIKIAGGQYRNYLSPLTHILVCRKAEGAKYKKAKDTNKVVVNVQWLNEVLFGHYVCIQQPDVHKYQQFNLSNAFRVDYTLIPHLMGILN